jgi:hypothetical protein
MMDNGKQARGPVSFVRVLLKGLLLFVLVNLLFAWWNPSGLGKVSVYNILFRGRERLPFGENPSQSYNLSLLNLDAMFASHKLAGGQKPATEYRVIVIGDSSVWGTLLEPEETLAGLLDAAGLEACDGRQVRVYNLGYPTISLFKDLMILDRIMVYEPDLIIWPVTLEAFPQDKQLTSPVVSYNAETARDLIEKYSLSLDPNAPGLVNHNFWQRTIIGQRRNLADLIRLQMYGVLWSATGIDQAYPPDYTPAQVDFDADDSFHNFEPSVLDANQLSLEIISAGLRSAGNVPLVIVNEPMLISNGRNSDIRYNFFYPRWAYDQYRQLMNEQSLQDGWDYLDLWDIVPAGEFTNSAIHMTPLGESYLAERLETAILEKACETR